MPKPNIKVIAQYLFFLGLGFFLIWYSIRNLSEEQIEQLQNSFSQVRYLYLIPVLALLLISHYSRALRWIIIMEPLGYKPSKANTYIAVLLGYFFNLMVPRLGEVMKCTVLAKYEKAAPDKLVGTIVAERALDLVCLIIITITMLIVGWNVVGATFTQLLSETIKTKAATTSWQKTALIIAAIIAFFFVVKWLLKRLSKNGFVAKVKAAIKNIIQGVTSIKKVSKPGAFLFHTFVIWACYLGSVWIGFRAFPSVEHLGGSASLSILVFGSLGMMVTQGGIGAYQIAVQKTLALYGIPIVAGLGFGWVLWGAQTIIVLLSGAVALIILPIINRKKKMDPTIIE